VDRRTPWRRRLLLAAPLALVLSIGGLTAPAANALVSSTGLPTAQLNGVAWTQVVVGTTVYVGGSFSTARPAGAAPGSRTVTRHNLLAYDVTTGKLKSWHPRTNGQVRALARSGDGRTIYATGGFTTVNGHRRLRIVAIDAATGGVRSAFHPSLNATGYGIAVKGGTVFVGGHFTAAGGSTRTRAAAFDRVTGALRRWAPRVNADVLALVVSDDGKHVVLGGRFSVVNGQTQRGSQRVTSGTGRTNEAWKVNGVVGNNGPDAAIFSLSSRGGYVYGTGYSFHPRTTGKRLEGTFVATWGSGAIHWIEDCHGDTYSAAATTATVYIAGHPHECRTVGGFHGTDPATVYHRALAFTLAATHRLEHNTISPYSDFGGQPAPTLRNWYPDFNTGTYTGQNQGPWSVVIASKYVAYAGEFTRVNGKAQQGLVRFPG
jgi:large repetitive protein